MMKSASMNKPLAARSQTQHCGLIHQAMDLVGWRKTTPGENGVKRIPAILLVDSFDEEPLSGVRNTQSTSRQMIYQAGDHQISLSIDYLRFPNEPTEAVAIMGQTMSLDGAETDIELLKEANVVGATKSDEFGVFVLEGIPEGIYNLRIKSKAVELDIAQLDATVRPH